MALDLTYRRRAIKDLRRLPPAACRLPPAACRLPSVDRDRAIARLKAYAEAPDAAHHDVIHLVGTPHFRLRVGDWRVVFEVSGGRLDVVRIGHRREVYR